MRAPVESPIGESGVFTMAEVMFTMRPKRRSHIPSNTARIIARGASMFASRAPIQAVAIPVGEATRAAGPRCC